MKPYTSDLVLPPGLLEPNDNHIIRRLSSMRTQFCDPAAVERILAREDPILYEVYEKKQAESAGELQWGTSIVHPGSVGDEYYMTKGHFHAVLETAEVYYCLQGEGYMLLEVPEGDWSAAKLRPGVVLHVPPRWAHRSINVGSADLITFFVYPGNAGHDYLTIESKGFHKLVLARNGVPEIVDNPRWSESTESAQKSCLR